METARARNRRVLLVFVAALVAFGGCSGSIHDEAAAGNLDKVKAMLAKDPTLLESRNPKGKTPLFYAVTNRKPEVIDFLLGAGADINASDITGLTPLHVAAWWDRKDEALQLLEHGADINAVDDFGDTPLHVAAFEDRPDMIDLLIEHGASLDAKNKAGLTPLQSAEKNRKTDAAQRLQQHIDGEIEPETPPLAP